MIKAATGSTNTCECTEISLNILTHVRQSHGMISLDDSDSTSADGNYDVRNSNSTCDLILNLVQPYDILVDVCPDGSSLSLRDRIRFPHPLNGMKGGNYRTEKHLKSKRYVANPPACSDNWTTDWANVSDDVSMTCQTDTRYSKMR